MLVGRSTECTRIERLLAAAWTGGSDALLVRGGPGVGKTALLRFARDRAEGMLVLEAQGVEAESELPYAGLSQLLRPVLDYPTRARSDASRTRSRAARTARSGSRRPLATRSDV